MEFLDYMKTKKRICEYYDHNNEACPLFSAGHRCMCETFERRNPEEAEKIVQEWADKHPLVTNADKFREVFGTTIKADNDNIKSKYSYNNTCRIVGEDDVVRWLITEYKEPEVKADEHNDDV